MSDVITMRLEDNQLQVLLERATFRSPSARMSLGHGVRDALEVVRTQAVRNVSGYPVSYAGGAFVVNVRTGALKGAIESEWPYGNVLQGRVLVNGAHTAQTQAPGFYAKPKPVSEYARAVEEGHGEIDLKRTMQGKVVPFFGARANDARGPYTETGLVAIGKGKFISSKPKARAGAKGPLVYDRHKTRSGSSYFITFRRVGKTGWIIPAAKPRPFMHASLPQSRDRVQRILAAQVHATLAAPIPIV